MRGWRTWIVAALILLASCAGESAKVRREPVPTDSPPRAQVPEAAPGLHRPVPQGPSPDAAAIKSYIRAAFPRDADTAVAVATCESDNFAPDVVRGERLGDVGEVGVFQIRPELHAWRVGVVGGTTLADWRTNVRVAAHLHRAKGWVPWRACLR